ncbi:YceI family protein [Cellvibrio sp.]|jgi:polyisoprenoid-binding protein YceI
MQHNFIKPAAAIFILLLLVSCGTLIKPNVKTGIVQLEKGSYQLDQTHVTVLFKINHMGLSTFVGRFNKVDATLEFDPANIAAAKLSAIIDVASIDTNNPNLEETLRGSSWLDTEKYPQAFFKTTSVNLLDQNSAVFAGELTLHGVTAPIDLTVTFNGGANNMLTGFYTLGFSATSTFNRSTFGVDYLVPAIGDAVAIEVFAEFQKN